MKKLKLFTLLSGILSLLFFWLTVLCLFINTGPLWFFLSWLGCVAFLLLFLKD